jgi:hypothetical protein
MIVVTGMHRSGTSFVAGVLHELGMDLGDHTEMYATDDWNAAGYFENVEVLMLNDRIVLGDRLYVERYRTSAPADRPWWARLLMSMARARYLLLRSTTGVQRRAERKRLEIAGLGERYQDIVVKDPRFSLTLNAWRRHATVDRVMYCYRHPVEIAKSLRRRDRLPLRMGLRLWAFHVEAFLAGAEGLPVTFVDYNRFFDASSCGEELARCFAFAGRPFDEDAAESLLARTLRRDLKHEAAAPTVWPKACRQLCAELEACRARHDRPKAFSRGAAK